MRARNRLKLLMGLGIYRNKKKGGRRKQTLIRKRKHAGQAY